MTVTSAPPSESDAAAPHGSASRPAFEVVPGTDAAGRYLLRVSGEVDLSTARELVAAAATAPADLRGPLRLDLSGLSFIDSTGIGALLEIRRSVEARGGRLELVATSPSVERVLSLTGTSDLLAPADGPRSGTSVTPPEGGAAFAVLAAELHNQETVEDTLDVLVEASSALVGSDSAAVLLARKGRLAEPGPGSNDAAVAADALQLQHASGPAWEAVVHQRTVHVRDTAEAPAGSWGAAAAALGVRSAISVRLWTADNTLGAITFYAEQPRCFDEYSLAIAEVVARHASIALASARHEESLNRAIDGRKLVGQAQGILMERFGLDDGRAFDVLRRYSQTHNVKLVEVARLLVETRQLPDA